MTGVLNQLAKSLGSFFAGRMQGLSEADSKRELMAAGMYRTAPATLVGYRVISAVSFLTTGLWLAATSGLGGPLVRAHRADHARRSGGLRPVTIVRRRARSRLERIDRELPELVDLLVVSVESGLGLRQLDAARGRAPQGTAGRRDAARDAGADDGAADGPGPREHPHPIGHALHALVRTLGAAGRVARRLDRPDPPQPRLEMRKRRRAAAEERAQKAPIKILFPLALLIFPALFVVLLAPAMFKLVDAIGGGS